MRAQLVGGPQDGAWVTVPSSMVDLRVPVPRPVEVRQIPDGGPCGDLVLIARYRCQRRARLVGDVGTVWHDRFVFEGYER